MTGEPHRPELTIIVPVYNERKTVLTVLERVRTLSIDKEIIVVDNHSTDGTRELLKELADGGSVPGKGRIRIVLQPRNYGKGTSVRTGIRHARGEWVIIQDGDLEYDPTDIVRLMEAARSGEDVVFGSRLSRREEREGGNRAFSLGRRFVTVWFNLLFGAGITDVSTCYKLMRSRVIRSIPLVSPGFDLDFEIPAKLARRGYRIRELPISYDPRSFEEGKKINWVDGLKAVWVMLRFRLGRVR